MNLANYTLYTWALRKRAMEWKDVRVHGLPPCDGETVYVGENDAGYMGCFNMVNPDGLTLMGSPEACVAVFSCLRFWRLQDRPARALTHESEKRNG